MNTESFDDVANYLLSLPPECWRPGVRGRARAALRWALQKPNRPKLWDPGFLGELRNIGYGTVAEVDRQAKAHRAVRAVAPLALPPRHEVALALLTAMISAGREDDDLMHEAFDVADDFLREARDRAKDDDASPASRADAERLAANPRLVTSHSDLVRVLRACGGEARIPNLTWEEFNESCEASVTRENGEGCMILRVPPQPGGLRDA